MGNFYDDPQARLFMHSQKQWGGEIPKLGNVKRDKEDGWWDSLSKLFTFGCVETSHNR